MKSCILYSTLNPGISGLPIGCYTILKRCDPPVWIRKEIVSMHYGEALDRARPKPGETVLNTIPVDQEALAS